MATQDGRLTAEGDELKLWIGAPAQPARDDGRRPRDERVDASHAVPPDFVWKSLGILAPFGHAPLLGLTRHDTSLRYPADLSYVFSVRFLIREAKRGIPA